MSAEPWFDPRMAGWIGGIGGSVLGIWGATLGIAAGMLVPRGQGKTFVLGMLYAGTVVGLSLVITGFFALIDQQPYAIWYPFLLIGCLLLGLSIPFVFVMKKQYQAVELRKMSAEELK